MSINLGVAPPNPLSPVGQLRLNLGDIIFEATQTEGIGDYDHFSDETLAVLLIGTAGSVTRATGAAIKQLALNAAMTGVSVKSNDLGVDNSKRGSTLLEIAKSWFDQADAEDAAGNVDVFEVAPFAGNRPAPSRPYSPQPPSWRPDTQNPGYLLV